MTTLEKIEIERKRDSENLNKIILFRDGGSPWYTAFEWSAYLLEFYPNQLDENKRLKPTRRRIKDSEDTFIKVGFQLPSLSKYVPDIVVNDVSEEVIEISIKPFIQVDINNYMDMLSEWKSSVEIKIDKKNTQNNVENKQSNKSTTLFTQPSSFLTIMKAIISYDTHNRDEEELREFILGLKMRCADLIC